MDPTLGWFRLEMVFASRSNRCFRSGSAATCSGRTLMATVRSRRVSGLCRPRPYPRPQWARGSRRSRAWRQGSGAWLQDPGRVHSIRLAATLTNRHCLETWTGTFLSLSCFVHLLPVNIRHDHSHVTYWIESDIESMAVVLMVEHLVGIERIDIFNLNDSVTSPSGCESIMGLDSRRNIAPIESQSQLSKKALQLFIGH